VEGVQHGSNTFTCSASCAEAVLGLSKPHHRVGDMRSIPGQGGLGPGGIHRIPQPHPRSARGRTASRQARVPVDEDPTGGPSANQGSQEDRGLGDGPPASTTGGPSSSSTEPAGGYSASAALSPAATEVI